MSKPTGGLADHVHLLLFAKKFLAFMSFIENIRVAKPRHGEMQETNTVLLDSFACQGSHDLENEQRVVRNIYFNFFS